MKTIQGPKAPQPKNTNPQTLRATEPNAQVSKQPNPAAKSPSYTPKPSK
jgi:hypothetical protein